MACDRHNEPRERLDVREPHMWVCMGARVDRDLGVLLTDNDTIAAYNQHFRGKPGPTDILSFPFHVRRGAVPSPLPHRLLTAVSRCPGRGGRRGAAGVKP